MSAPRVARPDRGAVLAFVGVVAFGGVNAIAVRQTVLELAPLWGAALRFIAAGLIFAALTLGRRRSFPVGRSFTGAMLYGTVGFALAFGLIYPALQTIQAGTASVVIALTPLATYGLAVVQRQERFRVMALVGALIAVAGIAIVFVDQLGASVPVIPLILVAVGMLGLSESGIIAKRIPRADPFATNAVAMTTAGVELLAVSFILGEPHAIPVRASTWIALSYITVFGSVAMFGLYLHGLTRWTASAMSYSTLLLPLVSVTVATVLTGEAFSFAFVVGSIVMIAGVYVGAFGSGRTNRSTATSLPECLPVDDCLDAAPLRLAPPERA